MRIVNLPVNFVKFSIGSKRSSLLTVAVVSVISILLTVSIFVAKRSSAHATPTNLTSSNRLEIAKMTQTEHYLFAATYSIKGEDKSTLVLNNATTQSKSIEVTLFNRHGEAMPIPNFTLIPNQVERLDVADWIQGRDKSRFAEGSMSIEIPSSELGTGVGAQLIISDDSHNISFDVPFIQARHFASSELETLWWSLDEETETQIFMANTTSSQLTVIPTLFVNQETIDSDPIALPPNASIKMDLEDLLREKHSKRSFPRTGGIRLSYNNKPGSLAVAGASINKERGFSTPMRFVDTKAQGTNKLYGAYLPIGFLSAQSGFPSTARFTPKVYVRNTTNGSETVKGRIVYTAGEKREAVEIASMTVAGNEVREIDLRRVIRTIGKQALTDSGIELEYTGQPGAIIAAATSVDQSGNQVFEAPMLDQKSRMTALTKGGVYPWRIDGDNLAVVHLKNVDPETSNKPRSTRVQIRFADSEIYSMPLQFTPAGQTITIDLKQLRDEQIPDIFGKKIPLNITEGQIAWMDRGPTSGQFVGRLAQYNVAKGTASSFTYATCHCGYGPYSHTMSPGNATGNIGGSVSFTVIELYQDNCNGHTWTSNETSSAWFSSSDSSIASVSGNTATLNQSGTVTITATWDAEYAQPEGCQGPECSEPGSCVIYPFTESDSASVTVQCVYPVNFRQISATNLGDGRIQFRYAWDSSDGNPAHLSACTVGELVTYPGGSPFTYPAPPYVINSAFGNPVDPNPTVIDLAGTLGTFRDTHSIPGGGFTMPYRESHIVSTQYYRYRCPCANGGEYVNVLGPTGIYRDVTIDSLWRYSVSKLEFPAGGVGATITLPGQ
jgi:hypothetical protein